MPSSLYARCLTAIYNLTGFALPLTPMLRETAIFQLLEDDERDLKALKANEEIYD
jgi:hypothetical protein